MRNIFSFDAEANGLWGEPFSIAAVVLSHSGEKLDQFLGRCPISAAPTDWVKENVLPAMDDIPETYGSYTALLKDFSVFYMKHKDTADTVVYIGGIVESGILWDMHEAGLIGEYDAPFPVHDVSGRLEQAGEDPTSLEEYRIRYHIDISDLSKRAHNPVYDAALAARVYLHLLARVSG